MVNTKWQVTGNQLDQSDHVTSPYRGKRLKLRDVFVVNCLAEEVFCLFVLLWRVYVYVSVCVSILT